ncbi:dihydrolipoamide acetyltransferase family protein [Caulobacter sp. S45]|uniref:dihydrolipoamide acetyltransferase family protein n=1 Tax=Caulobacter sp. S45 TaxID=1641861 RepID=UPI001576E737|nr:dihydrolipoamide acetyltransferase family protein [Caulobacter sp. S45]
MGRFTFRLPDVGEGTAEAEIVAWHVAIGDTVEEDAPLVDVMTDKATVEITSPVSGKVVVRRGEPGEMFAVGGPIVEFETDGGAAAEPVTAVPNPTGQRNTEAREAPPTTPKSERTFPLMGEALGMGVDGGAPSEPGANEAASLRAPPPSTLTPAPPPSRGRGSDTPAFFESTPERPLTSPAIRRRAREAEVDLAQVEGTGPHGRVTLEDFNAHLARPAKAAAATPDEITEVKVIGLRRKIAEKMSEAKRRIPHFAYMEECDVTELEDLRVHLNVAKRPDQPKLTFLPFMVRALVKALPRYPQINARYDDEAGLVRRYSAVHLGMATQTPNGLIVPVIRNAERRDVWALATEIGRLAKATREGKATSAELSGSTITLTSLGPLGGLMHTPVINHPEVAIVGPNKIVERPVVRNGEIVARKMMNVSSSFDHRVVDGWDAAEFIQTIKGLLEHPATLFLD